MIIQDYSFDHFQFSFKKSMGVGEKILEKREGYYIKLTSEDGSIGIGELSPLPGLHSKSLTQTKGEIHRFFDGVLPFPLSDQSFNYKVPLFSLIDSPLIKNLSSSSIFAIEMALFQLSRDLFPSSFQDETPVSSNQLYIPGQGQSFKDFSRSIKVKIGRQSLDEDKMMLHDLLNQLPSNIFLRLDGNRKFEVESLLNLLEGLDYTRIEYLEEPLRDINDWNQIYQSTGLSLAIDESLLDCIKNNSFPQGTKTWVIKPQLIGGLSISFNLIEKANQRGFQTVISSCFESPLGIKALNRVAAYQNTFSPTDAGLNTLTFFAKNISRF